MADYAGNPTYQTNVYLVETTDPVEGGLSGASNIGTKDLADRTAYFKGLNDAEIGKIMFFPVDTAPANFLKCNGARLDRTAYQELWDLYGRRYSQLLDGPGGGSTIFTSVDRTGGAIAHGFTTEDEMNIEAFGGSITLLFGGAGSPITPADSVFIRVLSANTFSLHPSASDATNNLNAAQQATFGAASYATIEYLDKVSTPDLRAGLIRAHDDGLGVYTTPLGGYDLIGTAGSTYSAVPLQACIKYQ